MKAKRERAYLVTEWRTYTVDHEVTAVSKDDAVEKVKEMETATREDDMDYASSAYSVRRSG